MHNEVKQWLNKVRAKHPSFFFFTDILECGSLNVNGSARRYFYFCDYIGIDLSKGKGVDFVAKAHEFNCPNMDVVISTEMLEHDCNWEKSLVKMYNNLRKGGLMIITCAGPQRPEHGTKRTTPKDSPFTNDYYRNISIGDFISVLPPYLWSNQNLRYARGMNDLLFWGIKSQQKYFNHATEFWNSI